MAQICIAIYPRALVSSVALPIEMITAANEIATSQRNQHLVQNVALIACDPDTAHLAGGMTLTPTLTWPTTDSPGLIILPAIWRSPVTVAQRAPGLLDWLSSQSAKGSEICAVGSASYLLARAGLLDGKVATTHWHFFDTFSRHFPDVSLKRDHLITHSAGISCVGSVNTLADWTVQYIARVYGNPVSQIVQRHFSPEIRKPCATQTFTSDSESPHTDEEIQLLQVRMRERYAESYRCSDLAAGLGINVRTLSRRFKKATGHTPMDYLKQLRIENAKDLLRNSNLSVSEIASRVGYTDAGHFSSLFKAWVGISPQKYRIETRAKLFAV